MTTFILKTGQKPSEETIKRLSELKDEDIVYDEDCPEMTLEKLKHVTRNKNLRDNNV